MFINFVTRNKNKHDYLIYINIQITVEFPRHPNQDKHITTPNTGHQKIANCEYKVQRRPLFSRSPKIVRAEHISDARLLLPKINVQ